MKFWIFLISLLLLKCNADIKKDFKLNIFEKSKKFTPYDTLKFNLENKKNHLIDSVVYRLDGKKINNIHSLNNNQLGIFDLTASVYFSLNKSEYKEKITIVSPSKPKLYTYKILNEYPHDNSAYTQGLEFYDNRLFESIGLRGKSALKEIEFKSGEVIRSLTIDDAYFAEGLTLLNKKIYQLTWQSKIGFIYDLESFELIDSFQYKKSVEGWGLCNNGNLIYKSDGTSKIWIIEPDSLEEIEFIQVTTNKSIISKINEMEWINGKIYANTYQFNKDIVLIINPKTGSVEGVVDFNGLKKKVKNHPKIDVFNGIAYNKNSKTIFMTGKNWNKLFELQILKK